MLQAAARMLLHDWNDGRIAYYTMPPARPDHGHASAAVVPAWGAEFNADEARMPARPCVEPSCLGDHALHNDSPSVAALTRGGISTALHLIMKHCMSPAAGWGVGGDPSFLGATGAQTFAAEQSAVIAGLPSLQEGSFFETAPAGEATADLAPAAADAGEPSWEQHASGAVKNSSHCVGN